MDSFICYQNYKIQLFSTNTIQNTPQVSACEFFDVGKALIPTVRNKFDFL